MWPSVEKITKPAKTDVAQLIELVTNASLQKRLIHHNGKEGIDLPIAIIMKFIIR
jgi:hypothetical protein